MGVYLQVSYQIYFLCFGLTFWTLESASSELTRKIKRHSSFRFFEQEGFFILMKRYLQKHGFSERSKTENDVSVLPVAFSKNQRKQLVLMTIFWIYVFIHVHTIYIFLQAITCQANACHNNAKAIVLLEKISTRKFRQVNKCSIFSKTNIFVSIWIKQKNHKFVNIWLQ